MVRAGESSENGTFQNNYSSFRCAVGAESCQERLETLSQGPRRRAARSLYRTTTTYTLTTRTTDLPLLYSVTMLTTFNTQHMTMFGLQFH